ncbi:MAG: tetratricopeptide repeat protein [Verrucomicrobiota bacterium]
MYRLALEKQRQLKGADSPEVANALLNLSGVLAEPEASAELDREAIAICEKRFGVGSARVAAAQNSLAFHLSAQGKLAEAEALHRKALAAQRSLFGSEHGDVAQSIGNLANNLRQQGKYSESEALHQELLDLNRKLYGAQSPMVAMASGNLGLVLQKEGKFAEAEAVHREGLQIMRTHFDEWHLNVSITMANLIYDLARQNKGEQVEPLLLRLRQTDFTRYPEAIDQLNMRASVLAQRGLWREAAGDAWVALRARPGDHEAYHTLAPVLVGQNDVAGYQELCQRIVAQFRTTAEIEVADRMAKDCLILPLPKFDLTPIDRWASLAVAEGKRNAALPFFRVCKAMAEYRQGRFASAVDWAERALESSFPYVVVEGNAVLAMAQHRLGQHEAARAALSKATAVATSDLPKLESRELNGDWRDWIISHRWVQEAAAVLEAADPANVDVNQP